MYESKTNQRLTKEDVYNLLLYFDDSSDMPLSTGLDFDNYSDKLSQYAYFILAYDKTDLLGFVAYYLNNEGYFVYVPQVVVHKTGRHKGIGHKMFVALQNCLCKRYKTIRLEVLKDNHNARDFYQREGFIPIEDRGKRILMQKKLLY